MTVTSAQVITLLENVLFESATLAKANATSWTAIANLSSSTSTVAGLSAYLASQPEATIAQQVVRYYQGALGRVPSPSEIAFYVNYAETGLTAAQIAQGASAVSTATWTNVSNFFANSPEFKSDYGLTSGLTAANEAIVITGFYNNVLGRAPTTSEITFYENALSNGATPATLVQFFTNSPEYQAKANATIQTNLGNNGTAAVAGTSSLTSTAPIGGLPAPSVTNVALTTGADTITGGSNFAISGTASTVTALDSIALTGTGNSLTLTDATAGGKGVDVTLFSSVSGVQTLNFVELNEFKGDALNVSGWTGLTTANITGYTINSGTTATITAGSSTAVNLTETIATAATGTTVVGGSVVTINETNAIANGGKTILVSGGTGTTAVSVTQTTSLGAPAQAAVTITDTNEGAGTKAGVITSVTINGDDGAALAINDSSLATLSVSNVTAASTLTITEGGYTSPATSLALTVNNDTALTLVDAGSKYTSLAITTGASASSIAAFTTFSGVTALTVAGSSALTITAAAGLSGLKTVAVSGAAGLTADLSGLAALTSVSSTSSGVITLTLNGTQETFVGGSGQDVITLGAAATKAITGGSATNNELVWNAAAATTFGNVTGFTVLGTAGTSSGSFDMSKLTTFTSLDVQNTAAGGVTFTKVVAGTALAIDATPAGTVTYQTADTAGGSDTMSLTFGGTAANATAVTVSNLTLEDSVFNGIGTVNVVSYDKTAAAVATATAFSDASLATLNVSGNAGLSLGAFTDNATSLTINGTETGTGGITLAGVTGGTATSLTSLTVTGSDAVTITLSETGTSFTVSDSATAAVGLTLTDTSAATETFTNTGTKTLTVGSHTGTALATLNLSANVTYTVIGDAVSGGITVNGGSDNNAVSITTTAQLAAGKVDSITLGNGANTIVDATTAGTLNITVGTGANSITTGTGTANITVGTHTALTGSDAFVVGANASSSVLTTITGAVAGDTINILDATAQALVNVTSAMVAADTTNAGNTTLLSNWIAAALDTTANHGANLAQHQVGWFNFQGNTYFVEQSAATGTQALTGDTIVKLVGTYNETTIGNVSAGHLITLV